MMTDSSTTGYSNPVRLAVQTREPGLSASSSTAENAGGPSNYGEKERLLRAKKRNEEVRRKGELWADKLMEETVDIGTFKRAVSGSCLSFCVDCFFYAVSRLGDSVGV